MPTASRGSRFDKAGASTNTLVAGRAGGARTRSLDRARRPIRRKGLVIRSGKASGFIAGADVDEFSAIEDDDDALAIVRRGWDTFERLAALPYPTLALVRGFCLGGGLELALACRYRVAVDEPGTRLALPEVMLGIVPGWGGMKRLPDLIGADRGARPDADRPHDRCAPGEEARARRRMRAAADHGEHRARHPAGARRRRAQLAVPLRR